MRFSARLDGIAIFGLAAILIAASTSSAQREFVEEVDPPKGSGLDGVDLDAPDPADPKAKPREPKGTDPKGTDPKATDPKGTGPKATDPKGTDPKATDPKVTDPKGTDPKVTDPKATDPQATDPQDPGTGTEPAAAVNPQDAVLVQETSYAALVEKWDARAMAVRKGEVARAKSKLGEVTQGLLDYGVQGIAGGLQATAIASALLDEAKKAIDDSSFEDAGALIDIAEAAAPDLVAVHTTRALLKWRSGDFAGLLDSFIQAAKAHARDPLVLSQIGARAIGAAATVGVLVLVLCALLMGLPALRYLSFDLLQALPRGAHGGQVLALVVMAGVAPLVVGAGPVFGSLWILSLAWLYLGGRERVVAAILAVACLALPLAIDVGSRLVAYPSSRAERAARALFDASAEPIRAELGKRVPGELHLYEQLALATAAKREGRLDDAAARYQAILAKHDEPAAHGGYGVVAALQGNEDLALAELGKAVAADEQNWAAAFNTSLIHYRGGRMEKATAAAAPLSTHVPELLSAFRRTTYREAEQVVGHNRGFVDVYPRAMDVLKAGLEPSPDSIAVADTLTRALLRGQTGERAYGLLGAFPILWLVLFALRKKLAPACGCVRCGSPASKRVDGSDVPEGTCAQCFHAFISTRTRIDAGVKLRKEREIAGRRTRLARAILVFGLLWPGAGHLFGGAPVRGLVLAVLHGLGLVALLFASGRVPMPRLEGPWSGSVALVVVGAVVGLVWLIGARSSWNLSEERR